MGDRTKTLSTVHGPPVSVVSFRVATDRAIVRNPKIFLMDEPLSNLAAKFKVHMRTKLQRLQKELGTTMIYVTHDQHEALR